MQFAKLIHRRTHSLSVTHSLTDCCIWLRLWPNCNCNYQWPAQKRQQLNNDAAATTVWLAILLRRSGGRIIIIIIISVVVVVVVARALPGRAYPLLREQLEPRRPVPAPASNGWPKMRAFRALRLADCRRLRLNLHLCLPSLPASSASNIASAWPSLRENRFRPATPGPCGLLLFLPTWLIPKSPLVVAVPCSYCVSVCLFVCLSLLMFATFLREGDSWLIFMLLPQLPRSSPTTHRHRRRQWQWESQRGAGRATATGLGRVDLCVNTQHLRGSNCPACLSRRRRPTASSLLLSTASPPLPTRPISGSLFALQFAIYKVIPFAAAALVVAAFLFVLVVVVVVVDAAPARFSFRLMVARARGLLLVFPGTFSLLLRYMQHIVYPTHWSRGRLIGQHIQVAHH